jgi:prepilin-type N-terminal cleavage/methylation domain-containing protein/prepilin-type processing-associated H-X9-DG protein
MSGKNEKNAFTLIELLVVIAILALLLAVLMPTLSKVRDIARLTLCSANQRSAYNGFLGWSVSRENRFPNWAESTIEYWSPIWANLVNREYYKSNDPRYYPTNAYGDEPTCGPLLRFWSFWGPEEGGWGGPPEFDNGLLSKGRWLLCPSFKAWGHPMSGISNQAARPWVIASNAAGGGYAPDATGKAHPNPQNIHQNYTGYYFGARQDSYQRPSYKYLMIECERGSDYVQYGTAGMVTLNADPARPPWTGSSARWSFRHLVPSDKRLIQQSARGPALFVDGHVGVLNPNDRTTDIQARFRADL